MHNFSTNLKRYIFIKTISSIATALILLPVLWYFDVPYAMFLALLAFALNYIPTVGSTIAAIPANYGMDVIDAGVPVLSMHGPWEVVSKADVYEAFKGYMAFLKDC